jgi:hypothetical protein
MQKVRDFTGFMGLLLVIAGLSLAGFYVLNTLGTQCQSVGHADCTVAPSVLIPAGLIFGLGASLFLVAAFVLHKWTETGRHAAAAGTGQTVTDLTKAMAEAGAVA